MVHLSRLAPAKLHLVPKLIVRFIQIGVQHGQQAEAEIRRALTFYKTLFEERAKLQWSDVLKIADQFTEYLGRDWPTYYEEIKGTLKASVFPVRSIIRCCAPEDISNMKKSIT